VGAAGRAPPADSLTTDTARSPEQAVITGEIGRSVTEAATRPGDIARDIAGVTDAAGSTAAAATLVDNGTGSISSVVFESRATVGRLKF